MATLDAFGYGDWQSRFVADLEDQEDREWEETEGGKAWLAGQRWMGRRVSRMGVAVYGSRGDDRDESAQPVT